jgi:hypothetical protein
LLDELNIDNLSRKALDCSLIPFVIRDLVNAKLLLLSLERLREDNMTKLGEKGYFNRDVIILAKQFYKKDIYSLLKQKIGINF